MAPHSFLYGSPMTVVYVKIMRLKFNTYRFESVLLTNDFVFNIY